MNLVVGATGMLGSEICRLLAEQGKPVRALVRETSNPDTVARLKSLGAEIVRGDLKDRASLDAPCRGVSTVISTASSTLSRQEGDSIESVDHQGQLNLVEAAEAAGVPRFVLISFPPLDVDFPLQTAKRDAEERLRRGPMTYSILQPTMFMEVWLGPALGFDPANGAARIYGSGENKVSWISFRDVAKFTVAALDNPRAENAVLELGGPEALSPLQVVRVAEATTGKRFTVEHVPEEALRAQHGAAKDPMERTFAGLMIGYANGNIIDMTETLRAFPGTSLTSVQEHFAASTRA